MSWLFSRALVAAFLGESSSGGEPCAPLNVMPTPRPFLLSDKTTAFSSPSQFGLTCAALTASDGAAVLMLFLADFPARTSAPPARARASMAIAQGFGFTWPGSFAKFDPDSRSWKTRQCSLLGGLESFSETWPRWGSMRDGECSQRPTPELRTSANESGLWPTVRSTDGDRGGRGDLIQAIRGNPNSHYKMWATPTVCGNYNRKGASASSGDGLATQAGGALNPDWVEWLMGWPLRWTASAPLEMDRFRQWLRSHGGY